MMIDDMKVVGQGKGGEGRGEYSSLQWIKLAPSVHSCLVASDTGDLHSADRSKTTSSARFSLCHVADVCSFLRLFFSRYSVF